MIPLCNGKLALNNSKNKYEGINLVCESHHSYILFHYFLFMRYKVRILKKWVSYAYMLN